MGWGLSVYDDSTAIEPVSLDDAKLQLKLPVGVAHPEDALIESIVIPAMRQRAEIATNRQLTQVIYDLTLRDFGWADDWLELPKPPLVEVISISYVDATGILQTLNAATYGVYAPTGPKPPRGRVTLAYGQTWPLPRAQVDAVTVRFLAGYSALPVPVIGPALPALLKQAMLMDISTVYEYRENIVAGTVVADVPRTAAAIYKSFKSWSRHREAA